MIYTIGHRASYELGLKEHRELFKKLGRCEHPNRPGELYQGGSVWRTKAEAEAYLAENQPRLKDYSVYGVAADWETETAPHEGMPFNDLLVTSQIVRAG